MEKKIEVKRKVLTENDRLAALIREKMSEHGIVAINLVSSPGSGKTSLLEKTLAALNSDLRMVLIAGDVQTENDADRLKRAGGRIVRPIITGGACHLDAKMTKKALEQVDLSLADIVFIENVGNLVCPASFDLGEDVKVVLVSTTEGDDKPLKYPNIFRRSSAFIINKTDLLGFSDFNIDRAEKNALSVNGTLKIFRLSCLKGDGLSLWYEWVRQLVAGKKSNNYKLLKGT